MKRLVIFSLDTFGDIALRQSFFKGLLNLGYEVTVVVQERFAVILPFLDARLQWITTPLNPKQVSPQDKAAVTALQQEVAACRPDALISAEYYFMDLELWLMLLFPELPRFGFDHPRLAEAFKIKQPWLYWKLNGKQGCFNRLVKGCQEKDHEFAKIQLMFKAITDQILTALPEIALSREMQQKNKSILKDFDVRACEYVIAALGGNTNASIKLLPPEVCAKTLIYIKEKYGLPAIMVGIQSEAEHLNKIAAIARAAGVQTHIWIGTQETFATLLYLIGQARFYYGSDTGAMHFAGAMEIPVVAHFGGGTWPRFMPLAKKSYVVCQDLPCYGCGWQCWNDRPLCITRVQPEALYRAIDWIIDPNTQGKQIDKGVKLEPDEYAFIQKQGRRHQRKRLIKMGLQALWRNIPSIFKKQSPAV